jgi:phospholipid-translocating ATPase
VLRCVPLGGSSGCDERWTLLHELPFTSERKRMSVVVRHEGSGECVVFSKGADDVMLPLLAVRDAGGIGMRTSRHIRRFARQGLRTLLMAMRTLEPREYAELAARLRDASVATRGRSEALAAAYGAIERELDPLGASAIEDSLQPGVPETIRALREAGICVWMLTGDKAETALEVARACRLVPPGAFPVELRPIELEEGGRSDSGGLRSQPGSPLSPVLPTAAGASASQRGGAFGGAGAQPPAGARLESNVSLADGDGPERAIPVLVLSGESPAELRECIHKHRAHIVAGVYGAGECASGAGDDEVDDGVAEPSYALMLAGGALSRALDEACHADFAQLALGASAVICARATPSEKAQVVRLVKRATQHASGPAVRVLAIGDGGNDVAMMQEAHIGVGLAGKEGLQAARAADYTLSRFRFLERLLLVHGRRAHTRTASICLYTFYKSIFFASMQVLHNTTTGFSGASLFPSLGVTVWNAPLTMLTGFSLLFDRDVSDVSLAAFPRLYAHTQRSRDLNVRVFALWWARAVAQAALCYWATLSAFGTTEYAHPATGGACELKSTGYVGYTVALYVQVLTVYAELKSIVLWNHAANAGCLALFHLGFWLYTSLSMSGDDRGLIVHLYADPAYWLGSATIAVAAVLPVALVKYAVHHAWPDETEVVQHYERVHGPVLPSRKANAVAGYSLTADA